MSINRNRKRTEKALDNVEYNILQKSYLVDCPICAKRAGRYGATCGPISWSTRWRPGYKNPRKAIAKWQAREYRTWKHNRNTQWK